MNKYDDIIDLPHHVSPTRPHMSLHDRAAQFSPFAALTGYSEVIKETARLTEAEILLDETALNAINEQLLYLQNHLDEHMIAEITYFIPDDKKDGGHYARIRTAVKKIDRYSQTVLMSDETIILMQQIVRIDLV